MVLGSLGGGIVGGAGITIVIRGVDNFSKTFKKAIVGTNKLSSAFKIGGLAVAGFSLALGGLGIVGIKTAASFETAFTGVRKTVDLTEAGFKELEQRFKDLTKVTPITFEQLSKIGELAGQLGVEGVDNLEKFTKTIADISVTTNLTAENASTSFARIANVMQEPLDNIDRMGATIVELGNNFATTEAEIVTFAERIAGAGNIVGLTTADIFAIGTALSSVGVEAEAGGTSVQRGLLDINKAVIKGGEKLDIFAKTSKLTTEEFKQLWEKDAAGAFNLFIKGLGEQGDQAALTLDDLGLGGVRVSRAFLSLANAGNVLENSLTTAESAWVENAALIEEAEKRYATFDSQIAILKNTFRLLVEPIGQQLIPIILSLTESFTNNIMPVLEKFIPLVGDFLIGGIEKVIELFQILKPALVSFFNEAIKPNLPELKEIGTTLFEIVKIGFSLAAAIITALAPAFRIIIPIFNTFLTILKEVFEFLAKIQTFLLEGPIGATVSGLAEAFGKFTGTKFFQGGINQDFISRPGQGVAAFSPNDTIIGVKNPGAIGGITININNVNGLDPEEVANSLNEILRSKLST